MASITYHLFIGNTQVTEATRAKKPAVVKIGEATGKSFRVVTGTGSVVHEHKVEAEAPATPKPAKKAPKPADDADNQPAPEDAAETVAAEEIVPEQGTKYDVAAMKRKIAKMLAKAEGTDNEHERETFLNAATRMMVRLGINRAELESEGQAKPEQIVEVHRDYHGGYALTFTGFANAIANGFGHVTVIKSGRGAHQRAFLIGHKSDVERCTQLLDSLEVQVMSALHAWQRTDETRAEQDNNVRFVGSKSFITGYGLRVGSRLRDLRADLETTATTGAALVLVSKDEKVADHMAQAHPKLGKGRGGNGAFSSRAMGAGMAAGEKANLGNKSVGTGSVGSLLP